MIIFHKVMFGNGAMGLIQKIINGEILSIFYLKFTFSTSMPKNECKNEGIFT